jgi:glutaconate CoA-transferase subunit A
METGLHRKEVIIDEREAGSLIEDGMTIAIGGFITSSHPMAIMRQVIRKRVRNLTVIGAASAGLEVDLLIGAGCVKKVITPYVGAEGLCPIGPFFRAFAQKGEIEIWECDEGQYYAGLRAAAQKLPFMPVRAGLGTSYPDVNPDLKVFKDPIHGEPLVAVPAIRPDVAIIHAAFSDPYGNVQFVGGGHGDRAQFRAADRTIVQVEKIVPNEEIRRNPGQTALYNVTAVVRAPYGSHPYASPGYYLEDVNHIKEYVRAATLSTRDGDQGGWNEYLRKYIDEPETHLDYLERIGTKRLFSLYEH